MPRTEWHQDVLQIFIGAPRTCTMLRAGRAGGARKVPVQLLRMMSFTIASVILQSVQDRKSESGPCNDAAHAGLWCSRWSR